MCFSGQRRVQRNNIRGGEQCIEVNKFDAFNRALTPIPGQDTTTKTPQPLRYSLTDGTESDQSPEPHSLYEFTNNYE